MTAEVERDDTGVRGQSGKQPSDVRFLHVVRESMPHNESEVAFTLVVDAVQTYAVM
ncbi:hypothetical protein GCM10022267_25160 [Lentzea roselyniae]|uniref:Transposase n=1 Tax=Lentzea roselyniae TaxID=531940 RepID=A0ABP7APN2_9PSEU